MVTKAEEKQLQDGKSQIVSHLAGIIRIRRMQTVSSPTKGRLFAEMAGIMDAAQMLLGFEEAMRLHRLAEKLADEESATFWTSQKEAAWIAQRLAD